MGWCRARGCGLSLPRRRPGPAAAAKFRGGSVGGVEDGPKGKEEMENRRPRIMNRRGDRPARGGERVNEAIFEDDYERMRCESGSEGSGLWLGN